ncbi:MAG: hypothetical protein NTV86_20565 [Planctomycetota bacterium]|nr:hypothetical protein [Planctomycetota bacterium]
MNPLQTKWFQTRLDYIGPTRIEFEKLGGWVEGPGIVRVRDSELFEIEVEVKSFGVDCPLEVGLAELLTGHPPVKTAEGSTLGVNPFGNQCKTVRMTCADGVFLSNDCPHLSSVDMHYGIATNPNIRISGTSWLFVPSRLGRPCYWVIPLTNFLSGFPDFREELRTHPLRIRGLRVVPTEVEPKKKDLAKLLNEWDSRVIYFNLLRKPVFIERLSDYEKREKRLRDGRRGSLITAVMIGEISNERVDSWTEVEKWFPFHLLSLLGLASGNTIGSPWIEFRDQDQSLVGRVHLRSAPPIYTQGFVAIDGNANRAIGHLLEAGSSCEEFRLRGMHAIVHYLIRGSQEGLTIEDRMVTFFRALECFCRAHGQKTISLLASLPQDKRLLVRQRLQEVSREFEVLAQDRSLLPAERRALQRIAERAKTTPTDKDEAFGRAVVNVIDHFAFPDAHIAQTFLQENPRSDGRSWAELLSYYRGITIHETYFDFRSGKHDPIEAHILKTHLHDLLLRMVLKTIGFKGTYNPVVRRALGMEVVDWVKPTTSPWALGYGRGPFE